MQPSEHTFEATLTRRVRLPYLLFPPDDAVPPPWPHLLFLHGSGERGTDPARLYDHGLPRELAAGRRIPFLVAAPQCPPDTIWSVHLDALAALVDHLQAHHPVDPARISVTGLSMGGTGTWHLAATHPHRFAAIAPVCGGDAWYVGDPAQVCALRHLPVWAFHGALDPVIPARASQTLVEALRRCGGNAQLTLYPDVGHGCWRQAYATPELYAWLAARRRADPPAPSAEGEDRQTRPTRR